MEQTAQVEQINLSHNISSLRQLNVDMLKIYVKLSIIKDFYLAHNRSIEKVKDNDVEEIEKPISYLDSFNLELETLHCNITSLKPYIVDLFGYTYNDEISKVVEELITAYFKTLDFSTKSLKLFDANLLYILENIVLFDKMFEILTHSLTSYNCFRDVNKEFLTDKVDKLYPPFDGDAKELDKSNVSITDEFNSKLMTLENYTVNIYSRLERINTLLN